MTVYKRKPSQPLKWLVALIVFTLAMGVTFSDVYGLDGTVTIGADNVDNSDQGLADGNPSPSDDSTDRPTTAIPEPTTLILLAGGLSALYIARRRKNRNK